MSISVYNVHETNVNTFNLVISVKINDVVKKAVIDTGAQVSVLNSNIFHRFKTKPELQSSVKLSGID